jgi:hypothetical protein
MHERLPLPLEEYDDASFEAALVGFFEDRPDLEEVIDAVEACKRELEALRVDGE